MSKVVLTSNVDNDVGVGELGQRLRNDSLSATESTWDTDSTTLDGGEEGVQDTLTDNEGLVRRQLLVRGTGHSHRPAVHHAVLSLCAVELNLQDLLVNSVAALLGDAGDGSARTGWEEDLVLAEQRVLEDGTEDITTSDVVANLQVAGCEVPLLLAVEGGQIDTAGDVDRVRGVGDTLEGTLNTIVDGLHKTRTQLNGQRLAGSLDRVSNSDTSCSTSVYVCRNYCAWRTSLLVDLNGGLVVLDTNDLSYEAVVADTDLNMLVHAFWKHSRATYKFVHGNTNHVLGHNDGTSIISRRRGQAMR